MDRKDTTDLLELAAAWWLSRRPGSVHSEVTVSDEHGELRLDLVHLGPRRRPQSTGIEVKSCRQDYTSDNKLTRYVGRVNALYVLTLPGVLKPEDLPAPIGLLELNPSWPLSNTLRVSWGSDFPSHRVLANQSDWLDIIVERKMASFEPVSQLHELDLLRGLLSRPSRIEMTWAQQREVEDSLLAAVPDSMF